MKVATKANVRTANAARNSLGKALEIAFSGGAVMGLGVVGLGILGLGGLFYIFGNYFGAFEQNSNTLGTTLSVLTGFSFQEFPSPPSLPVWEEEFIQKQQMSERIWLVR